MTVPVQTPVRSDLADLNRKFQASINPARLAALAEGLGLSVNGLNRLGIGWASRAALWTTGTKCSSTEGCWTFPMVDAHGQIRGIRLRAPDGFKYAVHGGNDGLFVPAGLDTSGRLLICEGPTDTGAMLDLGFSGVVGRSCCSGGVPLLVEMAQIQRVQDVVIVSDRDTQGQRGARILAASLAPRVRRLRVILLPCGCKDARQWVTLGGASKRDVEATINAAPSWGRRHG